MNLQAINVPVPVEWIVWLGSHNHKYLPYKVFRQKSEVFNSGSGFGIKYFGIQYSILYIREEIVSD